MVPCSIFRLSGQGGVVVSNIESNVHAIVAVSRGIVIVVVTMVLSINRGTPTWTPKSYSP